MDNKLASCGLRSLIGWLSIDDVLFVKISHASEKVVARRDCYRRRLLRKERSRAWRRRGSIILSNPVPLPPPVDEEPPSTTEKSYLGYRMNAKLLSYITVGCDGGELLLYRAGLEFLFPAQLARQKRSKHVCLERPLASGRPRFGRIMHAIVCFSCEKRGEGTFCFLPYFEPQTDESCRLAWM